MAVKRPPLAKGDRVDGKYVVDGLLGSGAMGVVVSATHVTPGHRVAIKCMLPSLAKNPEAAARFPREARAAVKLTSEPLAPGLARRQLPQGTPCTLLPCPD